MPFPTNVFSMVDLCMSSSVPSGGSHSYSMGNSLHEVPSSGGNIYPHMSNHCHVTFSSQATSSVSIPLHPFMNQYGGGHYPTGQGHGVYQNPSWPAISQNQSLPKPWSQMSQPTTATSPFTACHTGIISPTYASHVGGSSPTSTSHVGDSLLSSASHVGAMSPAIVSHSRGIHMIENPRCVRRKLKFLCRICERDHLSHFFPTTTVVPEMWSLPGGPLGSESSLVSQPSLVDTVVMTMQYSVETPLSLRVDASLDLVISHHVQPAVVSMQYLTKTTPIFGGDASLDLVS
jgi:hypothetical protein